MFEQIGVGLVQYRLVARRLLHRGLEVVWNDRLWRRTHVLEAAHVRGAPVVDLLGQRRFRVEPPRHAHRGHEHLRLVLDPVDQERDRHAGVIDEQPLAGAAVLAHRHVPARPPIPETTAPGRIAHAIGMRLAPFLPQQLQRHAAAGQVTLYFRPVHILGRRFLRRRIKRRLQGFVVHAARLGPAQTRSAEPLQDKRHRAPRNIGNGWRSRGRCDPLQNKTQAASSPFSSATFLVPSLSPRANRENPRVKRHTPSKPKSHPAGGGYFG